MPLFICDKCSTVENTACGHYHSRHRDFFGEELRGKALCSACTPPTYSDGSPVRKSGWHGRWKRQRVFEYVVEKGDCSDNFERHDDRSRVADIAKQIRQAA